jgi:predicted nucleotide-binding protein (sugar kinase/HSP70/actin superfamily)
MHYVSELEQTKKYYKENTLFKNSKLLEKNLEYAVKNVVIDPINPGISLGT